MENAREKAEKAGQTYAALGIGFVCIVIGLPLWWKTTEVYRVQLPYEEIATLARAHVNYHVDFNAIVCDDQISKTELALFGENLKATFDNSGKAHEGLSPVYRGQVRHPTDNEKVFLEQTSSLSDLDTQLAVSSSDHGKYRIFLIPTSSRFALSKPWVGCGRVVYIPMDKDLGTVVPVINKIVRELLVNEATITKAFYTAKGAILSKADKESMRSHKSHPGYEVTFTLLNPEPQILSAQWNIEAAVKEYMKPVLDAFAPFASINVKSQYLHYTGLGVTPSKDESSGGYKLTQDQLPHIITPIEAYLSSHVSTNPNLNFVVYVTPRGHHPLSIQDTTGESKGSNSFLSPRWGGILVYNTAVPENATLPASVDINMAMVMEVFLSQLRLLLGVNPQSLSDVDVAQPGRDIICKWELDQWLRLRAIENIATATSTLRSLAQLLEEISNIVINDDIGREVERAVSSVHKAQAYLQQAKLSDAFVFARQALLSSETAFFDPSLLELLYFPEDQKFAIYIPLFLPISIPVVMSVIQSIKRITGRDKVKKD